MRRKTERDQITFILAYVFKFAINKVNKILRKILIMSKGQYLCIKTCVLCSYFTIKIRRKRRIKGCKVCTYF